MGLRIALTADTTPPFFRVVHRRTGPYGASPQESTAVPAEGRRRGAEGEGQDKVLCAQRPFGMTAKTRSLALLGMTSGRRAEHTGDGRPVAKPPSARAKQRLRSPYRRGGAGAGTAAR